MAGVVPPAPGQLVCGAVGSQVLPMMFIRRKPSWKARLRLAWRVLRGESLYADFLRQQMRQFEGLPTMTNSTGSAKITYRPIE